MSRVRREGNPKSYNINLVQLEGVALMKIIKHCHEESTNTAEVAQGVLLGLMVDEVLEITNCFPFPTNADDLDVEEYQLDMMRHLRKVNVDHLSVGWYQSSQLGNFVTRHLMDSQFSYQASIEESVVLIYDPLKTARGFLSIKAYRLTPESISVLQEREYTPDVLRKLKLSHDNLFTEVKVVIKNSHLINALQCELYEQMPGHEASQFLDLGSLSTLDRQLRVLMESVDELSQEASKFNNYQRQVSKLSQDKHKHILKRAADNSARQARGEPPLPEEDLSKLFKPIPSLPRLDATVTAGQINTYCKELSQFCSQSLGKFFVAKALQDS
uniref:Eukaryotic translation initiation factor 3 subunit H n=2 Tax=Hirondellea gigas TaxID=1518452 RepID=A0A2P2HXY0_9CRUS